MTKALVLQELNMNDTELAALLGVSRAAVAQWPMDKHIPLARQLQLKHELRPRLFKDVPITDSRKVKTGVVKEILSEQVA